MTSISTFVGSRSSVPSTTVPSRWTSGEVSAWKSPRLGCRGRGYPALWAAGLIIRRAMKRGKPMPPDQAIYPAKDLCSRCGFCNTSLVSKVQDACAFLGDGMARIDRLEEQVHGRQRRSDEMYFGVAVEDGVRPIEVTQDFRPEKRAWTGVVTSVAVEMLQRGLVDAVLCVGSVSPEKPLEPRPMLARSVEEVLECGGVKPMLSPNLLPLEELWQVRNGEEIKRLLFIGVGCQVQALRSVEEDLGLDELYVLGTNCVDNPRNAEALQRFLQSASETPETAVGFEFMQDNRIHVKHVDGRYEQIPVFSLKEPQNCTGVIAKSCYSCFDYVTGARGRWTLMVNALTDVTVGYMAAPWQGGRMTEHQQYCVVRNERGQKMLNLLQDKLELGEASSLLPGPSLPREQLLPSVLVPELDLAFGQRQERPAPPRWLAEFLSNLFTTVGPRGLDFAMASIDRAALRNLVCLEVDLLHRRVGKHDLEDILPRHALEIRAKYRKLLDEMVAKYQGATVK